MATIKKLNQKTLIVGLTVALIFVLLGVFVFSYAMETLDAKAEQLGAQEQPIYEAPFSDYNLAGNDSQWVSISYCHRIHIAVVCRRVSCG